MVQRGPTYRLHGTILRKCVEKELVYNKLCWNLSIVEGMSNIHDVSGFSHNPLFRLLVTIILIYIVIICLFYVSGNDRLELGTLCMVA